MESFSRNRATEEAVPTRLLLLCLSLAVAAGCAAPTAPVVVRQILPPEIDTSAVEAVALLTPRAEGEFNAALRDETSKAIRATGRYAVRDLPPGELMESPAERVETAKDAGANLLLCLGVEPVPASEAGGDVEVTYTYYSGETGDKILGRTARASGKKVRQEAEEIADEITRCLMPRGIDHTFLLEYGEYPLTKVGVELARRGIWDQAERKWWTAARTNSNDSAAYHNLGIAFERRGMYSLASKAYQNAFTRKPDRPLYIEDIDRINTIVGQNQ